MPQDGSPANLNIFFKGKEVKKQTKQNPTTQLLAVFILYDFVIFTWNCLSNQKLNV